MTSLAWVEPPGSVVFHLPFLDNVNVRRYPREEREAGSNVRAVAQWVPSWG